MGNIAPHKLWTAAKTQASRLYAAGQPKGEYLDQAMGGSSQSYPLKFNQGLGPLLEKAVAANQKLVQVNKKAGSLDAVLTAEQALKALLGKAAKILSDYANEVKQHTKDLDEHDPRIAKLLTAALKTIQGNLVALKPENSMGVNNLASDCTDQHKAWSAAKAKSESAFKALLKDKNLAEALKKAKLTSYPCKFKAALGPSLDKAAKAFVKMDSATAKKALDNAIDAAKDYQKEIADARNAFKKAKITGKAVDDIFDPLDGPLESILN